LHSRKDIGLASGWYEEVEGLKGVPRSEQLNITCNGVSRSDFLSFFHYRVDIQYNEVSDEYNPRSSNDEEPQRSTPSTIFISLIAVALHKAVVEPFLPKRLYSRGAKYSSHTPQPNPRNTPSISAL
jgi:hypothetical protein